MKILLVLMLAFNFSAHAQEYCEQPLIVDNYSEYTRQLQGENAKAYIPAGAWYWNPDESGVGLSISVQESKAGNSGAYVFGAFYTYKSDGSPAWYTVQGEYVHNPNVNDWREDLETYGTSVASTSTPSQTSDEVGLYGCYWGNSDTWMGEVVSPLYETSDGPVLDGDYSPNDIFPYKDARLVWLNPNEIELYMDGSSEPAHTFTRQNLHGDVRLGDADYITQNTYHVDILRYGILPENIFDEKIMDVIHIQGNFNFRVFDPLSEFANADDPWALRRFIDDTELGPTKKFYISTTTIKEQVDFGLHSNDYDNNLKIYGYRSRIFPSGNEYYIVMSYDTDTKLIEGYIFEPYIAGAGLEQGLYSQNGGGIKFTGYLPADDQGRISLYNAACHDCGVEYMLRKEVVRRSSFQLYKVPDLGGAFRQMPNVFEAGDNVSVSNQESLNE